MRPAIRILATAGVAALFVAAAPAVAAPPNPVFCHVLFGEFNKCQQRAQRHGGWDQHGHDGDWGGHHSGHQGWGGGHQEWGGHRQGWGDDDGWGGHQGRGGYADRGYSDRGYGGGYERPRWRGQPRGQQADCSRWLVAMQLNRCSE